MSMRKFFLSLSLVAAALAPAHAQSPGPSGHGMSAGSSAAHLAVGVVKAVHQDNRTLSIAHQDIPSMGMPAMTMSFRADPGVNIAAVKPGDSVAFVLSSGPAGAVTISSLQPVAGGAAVRQVAPAGGMQGTPRSGGAMGGMSMAGMSMEECHEMMMKPRK